VASKRKSEAANKHWA